MSSLRKDNKKMYQAFHTMKQRCNNPNDSAYRNYGGRGIKICARWLGKDGFKNFYKDMGPRPEGCTLDRIDVNGDYCPENCRWAKWNIQAANKRNTHGVSRLLGVSKLGNKWKAEIIVNGEREYSIHSNIDDAINARRKMEKKHFGHKIVP